MLETPLRRSKGNEAAFQSSLLQRGSFTPGEGSWEPLGSGYVRPRQIGNSILGHKERRKASQGQKQNNGFGCGPRWSSIGIDFQICSISHVLIG